MDSTTYALPATPKQIAYARSLALKNQSLLPWEVQQDRRSLSAWIEAQTKLKPVSDMDRLPTSKQVAFAEKLARIKRRAVPDECFSDKGLMSKWIDGNKCERHRLALLVPAFLSFCHTVAWQTERRCQPIGWQNGPSGHQPRSDSCPKDQGLVPTARREVNRCDLRHPPQVSPLALVPLFFGNVGFGASTTLKHCIHQSNL